MARLDKCSPIHPSPYGKKHVAALQALQSGVASEGQQKTALEYIINTLCGTYDEMYRPDPRETDIAIGKRHVGLQIVKLLNIP